jgi:hypothetical protein
MTYNVVNPNLVQLFIIYHYLRIVPQMIDCKEQHDHHPLNKSVNQVDQDAANA